MKTIKVIPTYLSALELYESHETRPMRDLAGYMVHTGRINDVILGGALILLRYLNGCKNEVPIIQDYCSNYDHFHQIIAVANAARAGAFKKYALTKRHMVRIADQIQKDNLEDYI